MAIKVSRNQIIVAINMGQKNAMIASRCVYKREPLQVGDKEYCRRIDAITIHDFIQIAFQKYQLNLVGATW